MKALDKKVLILVPGENARGGITNYYQAIRNRLPQNIFYFTRGVRGWPNKSGLLAEIITHLKDYFKFIKAIIKPDVVLVQTTTALYKSSIYRDCVFVLLSKLFGKKVIVFFRGWDNKFAYNMSGFSKIIFKKTFLKADAIIDLSQSNINYLKSIGYKKKIYLETTLVDEKLLENVNIDNCIKNRINSPVKKILFLSRIEKNKGVYILLEAFKQINKTHNNYSLIYAGDGLELDKLKEQVDKQKIKNVEFTGFVQGEEKKALFTEASIFVFLSEYEGMPNAVLEAMAFGLPVITTNVGGISSIFTDKKNGRLINEVDVKFISENIINIIYHNTDYVNYSMTNYAEAKSKFWSSIVAQRMKNIFNNVLEQA
ncbi:MAG: glycosyltransferase [Bacteroidia bacterium]